MRGRFRQAIHAFETSAKLDPVLAASARVGVGAILMRTGDFDRAEERCAQPSTWRRPRPILIVSWVTFFARSVAWRMRGRLIWVRLKCSPEDSEAHFGLASVRLALGEMPEGWDDYEYRRSKLASAALQPVWNGEEVAGRTLLVHSEQGLGDAIQFLRYVPLLAARHAVVLLAVRQEIMALGATVEGVARVVEPSYTLPAFDFSIGLPSLPRMFRTTLETVPGNVPYIHADPARAAAWRERLGETDGLTVAIAWRGNPEHRSDHRRSILNGELAPVFKAPNVRFLVIQKDDGDAPHAENVLRLGAHDLNDIAAIMSVADITLSVDTVFCHLAGALGRPVWTMLCVSPDWRWQLSGDATPWYPTMRLFRQDEPGDWTGVVRNVMKALAEVPRRQA